MIGIALYLLVYHLNPETQWWGDSVRALGLRTSFTVALATAVGMLVRRPRLTHGARQFPLPYVLAIIFGLLALGSLVWGVGLSERGQYLAEKFTKILIILFILIRCVRTPQHYQLVIVAWLVGTAYVGYEVSGGAGQTLSGRLQRGVGGPDFETSSGLAAHLVATLPLAGAAFFMARTWWGRSFALVTGALLVNTIVATRTRSVLVGLGVMAATGVLSLPRGYRAKGLAAVVAGGLLAVQLTDPGWWRRMQTISHYQQDASATWRLTLWKAAYAMACDHPLGIGVGNFHHKVMEYVPGLTEVRSAHNTLMACLAELGWPGLLVFVSILIISLLRLGRLRALARRLPEQVEVRLFRWPARFHLAWHAVALRTALLGYLACGMFTTRLFTEGLWLLVGLGMCLTNVGRYMAGQEQLQAEPTSLADTAREPARTTIGSPAGTPQVT